MEYGVAELLGKDAIAAHEAAAFVTIYLAPHNYHRVHSPVSGILEEAVYIPGELWPVNKPFVRHMPRLFSRNERVVFRIRMVDGALVHAVMVGALNVGRIQIAARPDFFSNGSARQRSLRGRREKLVLNKEIKACDELGTFMLGSTVVLVFDRTLTDRHRFLSVPENTPIKMGQSLILE